jgi:integrase
MRHGFASLAFAAGVPLKTVSESLGHSSIGITSQLYVHLLADQKREKAAALDAYLDRAVRPAQDAKSAS